jgi:hypothetical protein
MEKDEEFNQLLTKYTTQFAPNLMSLLRDKKTFLIQCETERSQGGVPLTARFYAQEGTLFPMGTLLMINRKDLLTDTRILLPVWYSIPILTHILAFFKRLRSGGKKTAAPYEEFPKDPPPSQESKIQSQEQAIKTAATQVVQKLSANGRSPDATMAALENSWHTLLDRESKKYLIADVKSLVRDRLRQTLRLKLNQKISAQTIEELAASIYGEAPALKQLGDENSITTYIKLYIAKLLLTIKF